MRVETFTSSGRSSAGSIAAILMSLAYLVSATSSGRSSVGSIAARGGPGTCLTGGGVIRPILGRLHCGSRRDRIRSRSSWGHPADPRPAPLRPMTGRNGGRRPARSSGRSSAGSIAACYRNAGLCRTVGVIRPILGRLHCGIRAASGPGSPEGSSGRSSAGSIAASPCRSPPGTARWSSGRSSAGSIAAPRRANGRGRPRQVIRPILGRLHCGLSRRAAHASGGDWSSGRSSAGSIAASFPAPRAAHNLHRHPADPRPAPLRRYRRFQVRILDTQSSGRSSAGSIAAPANTVTVANPGTSSGRSSAGSIAAGDAEGSGRAGVWGHPADPRPAPLRLHPGLLRGSESVHVIRPILGRLHCGRLLSAGCAKKNSCHPADPRPAPLRRRVHHRLRVLLGRHPADPRPAPLRRQWVGRVRRG